MRLHLLASGEEAAGMRGRYEKLENELAEEQEASGATLANLAALETESADMHTVGQWLSAEVDETRRQEASACEEVASLQLECAEGASTLRKQQSLHLGMSRDSRELEASLSSARRRASIAEKEAQARRNDLEVQFGVLRTELQAQSAACAESAAQRTAREAECAELAAATEQLTSELEADEAVGVELESVLEAVRKETAVEGRELWAEEGEESKLAMEVAAGRRREEELSAELAVERERAQEASRVATMLLEQRRQVAEEADEALRCCDGVLAKSQASARAVAVRDGQLAQSQRSSTLMQETLGRRLETVHEQVREAEAAHARAMLELREERREHRLLHTQVARENASRRARLSRPACAPSDAALTWHG